MLHKILDFATYNPKRDWHIRRTMLCMHVLQLRESEGIGRGLSKISLPTKRIPSSPVLISLLRRRLRARHAFLALRRLRRRLRFNSHTWFYKNRWPWRDSWFSTSVAHSSTIVPRGINSLLYHQYFTLINKHFSVATVFTNIITPFLLAKISFRQIMLLASKPDRLENVFAYFTQHKKAKTKQCALESDMKLTAKYVNINNEP